MPGAAACVVSFAGDLRASEGIDDGSDIIRTAPGEAYFFLLLTASFSCLPALNLTALVAGILIRSAVCGLWPRRAFRCDTANVPKPTRVTLSFLRRLSAIASFTALIARSASALLI